MRAGLRQLRDGQVRDLRAIYDAALELMAQRRCPVEDLELAEVLQLADLSESRASQAYSGECVTSQHLHADLRVHQEKAADTDRIFAVLHAGFVEFADRLAVNDAVDTARIARELIRRSSLAHCAQMRLRGSWELHELALRVSDSSSIEDLERLATVQRIDAVQRLRLHQMYADMTRSFGLRPIEPLTTEEFAEMAMSTLEGLAMNQSLDKDSNETMRPTGPNGEMQRWSHTGAMFEALVLASVESDPFSDIAIDLSAWRT